jgi:hypothetical protein
VSKAGSRRLPSSIASLSRQPLYAGMMSARRVSSTCVDSRPPTRHTRKFDVVCFNSSMVWSLDIGAVLAAKSVRRHDVSAVSQRQDVPAWPHILSCLQIPLHAKLNPKHMLQCREAEKLLCTGCSQYNPPSTA